MAKRYDASVNRTLINVIEKSTGKKIDEKSKNIIVHGADELDLVISGLEETMK